MSVILSLVTAVLYGTGDFAGGKATRQTSVLVVVAGAHLVGLAGVVIAALLLADGFGVRDFVFGLIGGLAGLLGLGLLYRRLAIGPMMIVAPITAITSAAVPAGWGIARGDALSGWSVVGIVLAFIAIALVSMGDAGDAGGGHPVTAWVIIESLIAGVGFGTLFVFFAETDQAHAPWPVVSSRIASVGLLLVVLALRWPRDREAVALARGTTFALIAVTGVFDVAANVTFLVATGRGALSTVAVLSSLYPMMTVLLAAGIDRERVSRWQLVGLVLALVATASISAGG